MATECEVGNPVDIRCGSWRNLVCLDTVAELRKTGLTYEPRSALTRMALADKTRLLIAEALRNPAQPATPTQISDAEYAMKLYEMPDLIDLAYMIADEVKDRLCRQWYTAAGVELNIRWIPTNDIHAVAAVEPSPEDVQRHVITLSYGLLGQIYSNAFEFARFAQPGPDGGTLHGTQPLPGRFDMLHAAELMFISGVSFVIYHELGHLNQNHGAIRTRYGSDSTNSISEFQVAGEAELTGDQAAISHATELAADFEALDWLAMMLGPYKGDELLDHAYLQCAIVSCIMLMFNGGRPARMDAMPSGTHPPSLLRMDFWVRLYAERMAMLSQQLGVSNGPQAILKFLDDSSFLALLSCLTRLGCTDDPEYRDFCKGSTTHPNYKSYMSRVINIWSQHDDEARSSRRLGGVLSVLYFSDEHREMVGAVPNRDTWSDHVRLTQKVLARGRASA